MYWNFAPETLESLPNMGLASGLLLLSLWLGTYHYAPATGHVALTYPPARKYDLDFLDNGRTPAPCGMPKGSFTALRLVKARSARNTDIREEVEWWPPQILLPVQTDMSLLAVGQFRFQPLLCKMSLSKRS